MPKLRDIILRLMPRTWREAAIADSKLWQTRCSSCGHLSNFWDMGGLRWKAYGEPLTGFPCPTCGRFRMHKITKPDPKPHQQD